MTLQEKMNGNNTVYQAVETLVLITAKKKKKSQTLKTLKT